MKIISWNLNGLASCIENGCFKIIECLKPDIICCQEIRTKNQPDGYSLIPLVEANGERKSFAFRPERSMQDAREYVLDMFKGSGAPEYVVVADIKTFV